MDQVPDYFVTEKADLAMILLCSLLAATAGVNRTVLLRGNMAKTEKPATSGKMKAVLSGNSTAANISPDRRMSAARLLRGKAAAPSAAKSKN